MKLLFMGTAAAEGLPAVWCNCPLCKTAKQTGGKNVRTRSQILIDDSVLMDFPMDTYMHTLRHKLNLSRVTTVLITHTHMDHFYPQEFTLHGAPYAHDLTRQTVTVYGNESASALYAAANKAELKDAIRPSIPFITLHPYDTIEKEGYRITALPAKHTVGEECLIYAVEKGGKCVLLFNDSGILPDDEYAEMAKRGLQFDLVAFDCTYGHARKGAGRHMGALDACDEREKMRAHGLLKDNAQFILTHFSHNGKLTHEELVEKETPLGFTVAYDGMKVTL